MSPVRPLNAATWVTWAVAASTSLQMARGPVYVALVIGMSLVVGHRHRRSGGLSNAIPVVVGFACLFAALKVVLTALTTHGVGRAVVSVPDVTVPRVFGGFTVGGSIESPVVAQAALEALTVIGILVIFAVFNSVVRHHELLQLLPKAFYELGVILSIALTFIPSTLSCIADVREANRIRSGGARVRRGRLLRHLVPVIEAGLERAIRISESLDSRGFGQRRLSRVEEASEWIMVSGLLLFCGAVVALVAQRPPWAAGLGASGAALVVLAGYLISRSSRRSRYRPVRLTRRDSALICSFAAAPLALWALVRFVGLDLDWSSRDGIDIHADPLAALALLPLLAPVMARPIES